MQRWAAEEEMGIAVFAGIRELGCRFCRKMRMGGPDHVNGREWSRVLRDAFFLMQSSNERVRE